MPSKIPVMAASSAASGITSQMEVCSPSGNMAAKPSKVSARCGEAISANM